MFSLNYISQQIKRQFKKIGVETGLLAIKSLNLLGKLLFKLFRGVAGLFRFLLKGIFYRILVKIYYGLFRLKKNGLSKKMAGLIIRHQLIYLFIFILTALLIFVNLISKNKAVAMETKISKTVMADLTPTEFGQLPKEELIKEIATSNNILTASKEKYLDNSCTLNKETGLSVEENLEPGDFLSFNNEGDLIFKPPITGSSESSFAPQRLEIIYYTVQSGDTVSTIARKFGITVNTVLWANNLTAFSLIRPGDSLTILPTSGILYTVKAGDTVSKIVSKYGVDSDKILSCNDLSGGLKAGQKIILPGAKKITERATTVRSSSNSGLSVITNLIKTPAAKVSGNLMAWPTVGHHITQYFSWRHPGVDIGNKIGTPIYAADAGIVEVAQSGWNGGYGNMIVINHGGGKKTRYAHASKLFVKVGDEVDKGENIATMGSTGRSTGSHLHFEVIINGARYNPLNYIR